MTCTVPDISFKISRDIRNSIKTLEMLYTSKKYKKYEQHGIIGHFEGNDTEYPYNCHSMCASKVQMLLDSNLGVRAMIKTMVYQ